MAEQKIIVKVLGTAQDGGFPQAGCRCDQCRAAAAESTLRRYPAALALILPERKRWHLIDATPALPEQIAMMDSTFPELGLMSSILLTHAHIGHYTGLMHLGREVMATRQVPVYAGAGMGEILRNHVPWKQLVDLHNIVPMTILDGHSIELDSGLSITPLAVPHRNEFSETFGFIIAGPHKRLLYIPDIDRWDQWDMDLLAVAASVDYCFLDATFYSAEELAQRGRDYREVPHPLMTTTMDLLQGLIDMGKTQVYLTHLNHTNPAIMSDHAVGQRIRGRGFHVAEEGMELTL